MYSASGDVKYHLGTSLRRTYPSGKSVSLTLLPNPSHLEAVNGVVFGRARANMEEKQDLEGRGVMPIILHGDAAFAGQGIVYETMQFSKLSGYSTGGAVHVICNNQIGFTTTPTEDRSTRYASDLGKAFDVPIFHVNGDDTEAVCQVFKLAAQYRAHFHEDVVIDVVGYRRHGHNELDQPLFTQPEMYKQIQNHPPTLDVYKQQLVSEGTFTVAEVDAVIESVNTKISAAFDRSSDYALPDSFFDVRAYDDEQAVEAESDFMKEEKAVQMIEVAKGGTFATHESLAAVGKALTAVPGEITMHSQIKKILAAKAKTLEAGSGLDWGTAEGLAFGTLLRNGVHVRLSGQDAERGTFSHRHAVLHDQNSAKTFQPLLNVEGARAAWSVQNSSLSEFGVLGFELGYSQFDPNALVIWEAQFGDFANGAQIMIDQFICTGEAKWFKQTGLVMLLPHGYEGQGPEHSSCRIERFLQNSEEDPDVIPSGDAEHAIRLHNWQIVNCSTPANYFHVLRRQVARDFRKPLVVATPKSLLRHKLCVSSIDDFGPGTAFQRLIGERDGEHMVPDKSVDRVVFCSGKIYYELVTARAAAESWNVAIVTMEQISPFPFDLVAETMKKYENAEVVWAQEEPKNMGAWYFVLARFKTAARQLLGREITTKYIGRRTMSAPAEGYGSVHTKEQAAIVSAAVTTDHDGRH
jgi:2-oxoglutarate dehydrogenase E1 component